MKLIHDYSVVGCFKFILQHKLKRLKIELRGWNKNSFGNVHKTMLLKQASLLGIQQNLESTSLYDIDGLICQEMMVRRSLIMCFIINTCFGKRRQRCFGLKMGIEILLFFMLWNKGEIILVGFTD